MPSFFASFSSITLIEMESAPFATSSAAVARYRGVQTLGGSLTRSRVRHVASEKIRARSAPSFSAAASPSSVMARRTRASLLGDPLGFDLYLRYS